MEENDFVFVEEISTTPSNSPMLNVFLRSKDNLERVARYMSHVRTFGRYRILDTLEGVAEVKKHLKDYTYVELFGRDLGEHWTDYLPDWMIDKLDSFNTRGRWYDTDNIYGDRVYQFYESHFPHIPAPDHDVAPQWVHDIYDSMDTRNKTNTLDGFLANRLGW